MFSHRLSCVFIYFSFHIPFSSIYFLSFSCTILCTFYILYSCTALILFSYIYIHVLFASYTIFPFILFIWLSLLCTYICCHIFSYDILICCHIFSYDILILCFSYAFRILCFSYSYCTVLLVLITVYTFIA